MFPSTHTPKIKPKLEMNPNPHSLQPENIATLNKSKPKTKPKPKITPIGDETLIPKTSS